MSTVAILLAAGESTRMSSSKPLLAWGEGNLIQYELGELKAVRVDTIPITPERILRALGKVKD